jgi:hypothetical protein
VTDQLRLRADFNGLFGDILCLSHEDTCPDEFGKDIELKPGLNAIAFDEDVDEHGQPDDLIASGVVEPSPAWLQCKGSRWCLKIDKFGVRHQSDIEPPSKL